MMATEVSEGTEMFVAGDGVELPVTRDVVSAAREHFWYVVDKKFNRIFYGVLLSVGVEHSRIQSDLKLLTKYKGDLGLSLQQLRGAYGLMHGVMERSGKFVTSKVGKWKEEVELLVSADPDVSNYAQRKRLSGGVFDDQLWDEVYTNAIQSCVGKADHVSIEDEFDWIHANQLEWPDFGSAPSKSAIKDWLRLHMPGNSGLGNDLTKLIWTRRLSSRPVKQRKNRGKRSALSVDDDALGQDDKAERDGQLGVELFGD